VEIILERNSKPPNQNNLEIKGKTTMIIIPTNGRNIQSRYIEN